MSVCVSVLSSVSSYRCNNIIYCFSLPAPIKRGRKCPYFVYGYGTLFEYEALELVHEVTSQWQNVKIYKSPEFGNMLVLDDNISELYTTVRQV